MGIRLTDTQIKTLRLVIEASDSYGFWSNTNELIKMGADPAALALLGKLKLIELRRAAFDRNVYQWRMPSNKETERLDRLDALLGRSPLREAQALIESIRWMPPRVK